jgi:hypothetical protein
MPGLVFLFLIALYLVISLLGRKAILAYFFSQLFNRNWATIGVIITAFVASGAIGFILTSIYYSFYWSCLWNLVGMPGVDHSSFLKYLKDNGYIKIINRENCTPVDGKISKSDAWCIITAFWHERLRDSTRFKNANKRTDSMTDIMHGLGATTIGSIIAGLLWVIMYLIIDISPTSHALSSPCFIVSLCLSIFIFWCFFINYRRVATQFQNIVEIIVTDEMTDEKLYPLTMFITSEKGSAICNATHNLLVRVHRSPAKARPAGRGEAEADKKA